MGELGDLLELMHGARFRYTTVRATVRRWSDQARSQEALHRYRERLQAQRKGIGAVVSVGTGPALERWESTIKAWVDEPNRRQRVEHYDEEHGDRYTVVVGDQWWSYSPRMGALTNEGDPQHDHGDRHPLRPLLDPAPLMLGLQFTVIGQGAVAGRPGRRVRAVPQEVDPPHLALHGLDFGADEYELVIDDAVGVLLRTEARLEGRAYGGQEVTEIAFDKRLDDELFVFHPPPGEDVRSARDQFRRPEPVTVEEAAQRAPFTLLVPCRIPQSSRLSALFMPAQDRLASSASVVINLVTGDIAVHQVSIRQSADAMDDALSWESVVHDGQELLVWTPESVHLSTRHAVKLERHGTYVRVEGDLDRETLLGIATSLEPAPTTPPPLVDR